MSVSVASAGSQVASGPATKRPTSSYYSATFVENKCELVSECVC